MQLLTTEGEWRCPECSRLNKAEAKFCSRCNHWREEKSALSVQKREPTSLGTDEKELLSGKLMGIGHRESIILTTKRLIIAARSIDLSDILEVYSTVASEFLITTAKMVVRLKDGEEIEVKMVPENQPSWGSALFGDSEGAMRDAQKATHDRWVNLINRLLK